MFSSFWHFSFAVGLSICLLVCEPAAGADPVTPTITSLPVIDRAIHDAMQSKSYGEAVKLIESSLDDNKHADYLRYLQGVAFTEAKQYDEALNAFAELESQHPKSSWISRSRFGRANVHVLRRDYIQAGEIYQAEAERLLSRGRKDTLAKIYLEFADRYFDGVPADDPSKAKKPDYKQALTFYTEAEKLGPSSELRQRIQFRIARCLEEQSQHGEAISRFQSFLKQYAGESPASGSTASELRQVEAGYRLGSVQLAAGQSSEARKTWQDLVAKWKDRVEPKDAAEIDAHLSRAEYRLAHTYGLPEPTTVADLELAVAIAEQFLDNHPDHELAPRAELEIAKGYSKHGRHQQAVSRLQWLIDNPKYAESEQVPVARQMLGSEFLAQSQFDQAIDAWKDFLDEHPTDPNWPTVQKQIVDTEYAKASTAKREGNFEDARTIWQTFLNKYPLDPRAANVLLQFGQMKFDQANEIHMQRVETALERGDSAQSVAINERCRQLYEEAIVDWRRVVSKYPTSNEASQSALLIGMTLEDRLAKLKEALDAYQAVSGRFAEQAKQRITRLTTPQLQLMTERKFRSDEKPRIKLTTRNLKNVRVKAYRIDMTDYFRKMHLASGVETLDIALIDPDQQFQHEVDGFEQYKQVEGDIELPIAGNGVTAVTVSSDKLEATTMVVVSDLDMVVKTSRNELFLFAENMREGKPMPGVSVLISDGSKVFAEEMTNEDGILQKSFDQLKSVKDLRVFAIHEGHVASTVNNLNGLDFAVGLTPRGYIYTDRPAYRSGQLVNVKAIVRWVDQDRFTFRAGEKLKLDVYDPRGRQIHSQDVALNNFGTVHDNVMLPESAQQGDYRIHLHRETKGPNDSTGKLSFETRFTVTEYKLEPVDVAIDVEKDVYFRGEMVTGSIQVKYYYGTPLSGETVHYRFGPNGESVTATTDDAGLIQFDLPTQRFNESGPLQLVVEYPERGLTSSRTIYLATRGFEINASTMRDVFINGESFETLFQVADPSGKSVATKLKVEVFQHTKTAGQAGQKLIETHQIESDAESGQALQSLTLNEAGTYSIRATAVDQFENEVSGQSRIAISGDKDSKRLRILADQHSYRVGDQASVNLHWREQPALALVTFEGATVLGHQLVELKKGKNDLAIPMQSEFAPNVFVSVAVMQRNQFHTATTELRVAQELNVTLKPNLDQARPGDEVTVQIEVTDPQGNPVQGELSLALVQSNLLDRFQDIQGAVSAFFSTGLRQTAVRQATSCTFIYRPKTAGVSQFLLAEADRRRVLEREVRALAELREEEVANAAGENDFFFDQRLSDAATLGDFAINSDGNLNTTWMAHSQTMTRREQRTRSVPIVRYRTETRDGKQVQVPYTVQAEQSYTVAVPYTEQVQQSYQAQQFDGLTVELPTFDAPTPSDSAFAGTALQQRLSEPQRYGSVNFNSGVQTLNFGEDATVNGVTWDGRFVAINAKDEDDLGRQTRELGLQIIPAMTHSETGYWDPAITTDSNGKATVTITMPKRSTAWQLRAKGINAKTLSGEGVADLITKKDLFGELKLPLAFTVGDKATIPVEIHNSLDGQRKIKLKLKTTLGGKSVAQVKDVDVDGPGVSKSEFVIEIEEADRAQFELSLSSAESDDKAPISDSLTRIVQVRPYGFPVYQTASGTSSQSTMSLIQFDPKLDVKGVSMEILIGANLNRSLLESVLGEGLYPILRCGLPTASQIERSVSDLMGGVALLEMVGESLDQNAPEGLSLKNRINAAVAQLVSSQQDKGGWAWSGNPTSDPDTSLSARVVWALSMARDAGFVVSPDTFAKGKTYLKSSFAATDQTNLEQQTVLLHAMAVSGNADFAFANRLHRERNRLSPSGLIHLALTLAVLNREEMSRELLAMNSLQSVVSPAKGKTIKRGTPWMRNHVELQAMYLMALQEVRPSNPDIAKLAKSLLAARIGSRWPVEKANGPAIAALANWHSRAQLASEKYTLTIWVNDRELKTLSIDPAKDGSQRISVPSDFLQRIAKEAGKPHRLEFKLAGRATFSHSTVLTGFVAADQITSTTRDWHVTRRYEPAQRTFAGRSVPRGFSVINGSYRSFTNPLTQLPVGERTEVTLSPRRNGTAANERYDYLVLTEPIPAGCTVLEDSVRGRFERFELEPGQITFYLGDRRYPEDIQYTLVGYVPGEFQAPQSILRSFYEPASFAVSKTKELRVLSSGTKTTDEYRLTPDELYHLGQLEFERDNFDAAHQHLSKLYADWRLDNDKAKQAVQWLFSSSLAQQNDGDIVKYFEVLKERYPDVELSFEDILHVAKSYRELGEYERGYLVYRATVEGSFERESQVAGFLNARGEFVRSVQAMERLLRDYPAESYIAIATYALAQETYRRAPIAKDDKTLVAAGINRVHLIDSAIEMLDHFVTGWPQDPANDQASFALATALIDLEQYEDAIEFCQRYADRYPDSRLLDSFWYMIGYSHFELQNPEAALTMCRKVAEAQIQVPETGGTRAADNRWEAIYIMGQIYHSLGEAANAIAEYTRVDERFADAAEAINFFNRKDIGLDEVTAIQPDEPKKVELRFRNIGETAVKVYRIDLMKFGLMQRNLDRITAINLAGIKPYHEETVQLGDGKDFRDRTHDLQLPLKEEGAYLIVCRGDNLYASGLALVSPLELLVQEDATSGRIRVSVKDASDDQFADDVHVKVIGSANEDFVSGETDLRGLFIADDIQGNSTVIAVRNSTQYAFYRGDSNLQVAQQQNTPAEPNRDSNSEAKKEENGKGSLRDNLFNTNRSFQLEQKGNYDDLLNNGRKGIKTEEAF